MSDSHKNSKPDPLENEKKELELEKIKEEILKIALEKEKLQLESKELRKGFLHKPQWWVFFTTTLVSVYTLANLFATGAFSTTKAKTERDLILLETRKTKFEKEQSIKEAEFELRKTEIDSLIKEKRDSLSNFSKSLTELLSINRTLLVDKSTLVDRNKTLKSEIDIKKDSLGKLILEKVKIEQQMNNANSEINGLKIKNSVDSAANVFYNEKILNRTTGRLKDQLNACEEKAIILKIEVSKKDEIIKKLEAELKLKD